MQQNLRPVTARWPALTLAAALALAGCSALQIDVDVYKGSLSHEKDIQTRQFAAAVMAAKPVLARLRNEVHAEAQLDAQKSVADQALSASAGQAGAAQ